MAAENLKGKPYGKRYYLELIRAQLDNERSSFDAHWRDIADFVRPRRPRFFVQDINNGDRRSQQINDTTATFSSRTLSSGMMSGVTSPARPWFRIATSDPMLNENENVKGWLYLVTTRMTETFLRSNLYNVLPTNYRDMGDFGIGAIYMEEDYETVFRFMSIPIGSYRIATNAKSQVDTFQRDFGMTVKQIVDKFGRTRREDPTFIDWSVLSSTVKNQYENGMLETWIEVSHIIQPNENFDPSKLESQFKKYQSCYYERGTAASKSTTGTGGYWGEGEQDKMLRVSGYDYFPVFCPRWEVNGEDSYSTDCPGMTALGDVRQLQLGEKRALQAIEKMINPPMIGPSSLKKAKASILPGDITYMDLREGMQGFRAAHEVNFNIQALEEKQEQVRKRISRAYFEDLFLMLSMSDRREITAREIDERHEEKLLALGPVLEQLNQDLLDPLIDVAFIMMNQQGLIPPPPQELEGMKLKVEYISIMAQAQKLVALGGLERFTQYITGLAAVDQSGAYLDKVNVDQLVDEYSIGVSLPPGIVNSDEKTAAIRADKAKAQAAQAQSQQLQELSGAAKNLSQSDLGGDNALSRVVQSLG